MKSNPGSPQNLEKMGLRSPTLFSYATYSYYCSLKRHYGYRQTKKGLTVEEEIGWVGLMCPRMFEAYYPFVMLGLILILIGVVLVMSPFLAKYLSAITWEKLEKLPWILLYVYRRDNFLFVTSPILIIVGLLYLAYILLKLLK